MVFSLAARKHGLEGVGYFLHKSIKVLFSDGSFF